jgi:hypothetical protein
MGQDPVALHPMGSGVAPWVALLAFVGCGKSAATTPPEDHAGAGDAAILDVYINPACPVFFSAGCCGQKGPDGSCPCEPFSCVPIPAECADAHTCECIECVAGSTCSCGGGSGTANCEYDAGTFKVECNNL